MAIWFDTLEPSGITVARLEGAITPAMVAKALAAYFEDRRATRPRRILADVSDVDDFEPSYNDMVEVVELTSAAFAAERHPLRLALAATGDLQHGRASLFLALAADEPRLDVSLHRSVAEAARALGLPRGTALPPPPG